MSEQYSFRFADDNLNRQLVALLNEANVPYTVDTGGTIRYAPKDDPLVGNELIPAVRARQFGSWQVVCCPASWLDQYKNYMKEHRIPFKEEVMDGEVRFLIPQRYRPHSWQLENGESRESRRGSRAEATE